MMDSSSLRKPAAPASPATTTARFGTLRTMAVRSGGYARRLLSSEHTPDGPLKGRLALNHQIPDLVLFRRTFVQPFGEQVVALLRLHAFVPRAHRDVRHPVDTLPPVLWQNALGRATLDILQT